VRRRAGRRSARCASPIEPPQKEVERGADRLNTSGIVIVSSIAKTRPALRPHASKIAHVRQRRSRLAAWRREPTPAEKSAQFFPTVAYAEKRDNGLKIQKSLLCDGHYYLQFSPCFFALGTSLPNRIRRSRLGSAFAAARKCGPCWAGGGCPRAALQLRECRTRCRAFTSRGNC